jgi:hypothetical protein
MSPPRNAAYIYVPDDVGPTIPRLYATKNESDPIVWLKLFTPDSSWSWYIIEFDGDDRCFGYVVGHEAELGYFLLSDIACARGSLGLPVERDLYFTPCPLSDVRERHA